MTDGPLRDVLLHVADILLSVGLVKGSLLLLALALLARPLRRASAAVRAGVLASAIAVLASLPLLWHVTPWWEAGVVAFPRVLFANDAALSWKLVDVMPGSIGGRTIDPPAIWLAMVWAIGAAGVAAHFLWQRLGVELIARAGEPARDERTLHGIVRAATALGVRRPVRAVHSTLATAPYAFGIWRATIVLPTDARGWNGAQLDAVLRHELAHVVRADYLLLLVGELVRVLYWFNPAVWLALRSLRRAQDAACDDLVLRTGVPAVSYARHLVAVARSACVRQPAPRAALSLVRSSDLHARVSAVLDRSSDRRPLTRIALVAGSTIAAVVAITIASANPWICPAEQASSAASAVSESALATAIASEYASR